MGKALPAITDRVRELIEAQHMFFVATAPLGTGGHVNMSPKGLDTFSILGPNCVAYLDLTGSGNETSAHLLENGRITFMFCTFAGPPSIVRLYGSGRVVLPDTAEWGELRPRWGEFISARQIIVAAITRVQTSCGYAVPLYDYVGQRDTLLRWADAQGAAGLEAYRATKNMSSIDGLPTPLAGETSLHG